MPNKIKYLANNKCLINNNIPSKISCLKDNNIFNKMIYVIKWYKSFFYLKNKIYVFKYYLRFLCLLNNLLSYIKFLKYYI